MSELTREEHIELYNQFAVMSIAELDAYIRNESDYRKAMKAVDMLNSKKKSAQDLQNGRW